MNFASALINLMAGHKIARSIWKGYWVIEDGDVIMYSPKGEHMRLAGTDDIRRVLSACACDDWAVVDDRGEV